MKTFIKSKTVKYTALGLAVLLFALLLFVVGNKTAKFEFEESKITYNNLITKISEAEEKKDKIEQ
ncbi:hypothetical protein [Thalassobacillus sp. CUG 92003]|uniref:hypothetical protein n=1 Tax=Thalassobacillus sp. CUG 92003 TaxID=2736641 RepID=UPI0015E7D5A5|nr:hypothetical protein [Thalassobacillus sp. CUG 92003]